MAEVGRKTVMTDEVLKKIKSGFMMGFSDREACAYAEISNQTLYDYQKLHPEFIEQKEQLKENPILLAKNTIYGALHAKDKDTAKWYLERKAKNEFSLRNELTGADGQELFAVKIIEDPHIVAAKPTEEVKPIEPPKLEESTISK